MKSNKILTLCASLTLGLLHLTSTASATVVVSQGKTATAFSTRPGGYVPSNAVDGNLTSTPWSASNGAYPQWWNVDLGMAYAISSVSIKWVSTTTKYYQYKIEVSTDGVNYTTVVDRTTNTTPGDVVDTFPSTQVASNVRVTMNGSSPTNWASFYECQVMEDPSVPAAPTGLSPMEGDTQVALSWATVSGATGYNVYRATTSGGPYTIISTNQAGLTFTDTGRMNGTGYYYVVRALNASGEGSPSTQVGATPTNLPSPWLTKDIGTGTALGSASFSSGTYTAAGSGADIGGSTDSFRYVYQAATGDCTVIARVATEQNTNALAKAGVMIRDSLAANAINASVVVTPSSGIIFQRRTSTGGGTSSTSVASLTAPYWVKLIRTGNSLTAFRSPDGSTWTAIGSAVTVTMGSTVYIGFPTSSHVTATLCTSTFDNVTPGIVAPPAPTGLGATAISSSRIDLSWTASSGATSYKVERSLTSGSGYSQIGTPTGTTYSDTTGLSPSTTYYYRVQATNAGGDSGYSSVANATTLTSPPLAPSAITFGTVTASSVIVNWTSNSGGNETGFKIERSLTAGSGYSQIGTTGTGIVTYTDSTPPLSTFTTYYYRVRATNAGGDSGYAPEMSTKTLDTIPAAPSGVGVSGVTSNHVTVTWMDNSNGATGNETSFKIERKVGTGGTFIYVGSAPANATSFPDDSASSATAYYYRVSAINSGGTSTPSATSPVANTTGNAISTPTTLASVTVTNSTSISLTWTDNSNSGTNTETGFIIERSLSSAFDTFTPIYTTAANATSYTDNSALPGTVYYYRVRANNTSSASNSNYSTNASVTTRIAAPSNVQVTMTSLTAVNVSWNDNSNPPLNELNFSIEKKLGISGTYAVTATAPANSTSYPITGLSTDSTYYFQMLAGLSAPGRSVYSTPEVGVTMLPTPTLRATPVSSTQIDLAWDPYGSTNQTGFIIERKPDLGGSWTQIGTPTGTDVLYHDTTGLSANSTYIYRIRAKCATNDGLNSAIVNVSTLLGGTLPSPWVHADIGTPPTAGDAGYSSGTFTIKGSGSSINYYSPLPSSENFHFIYQPLSGDGTIVAHVVSLDRANEWANTGVMIRETLTTTSNYVMMALTPGYGHGSALLYRSGAGNATKIGFADGIGTPYWVKIVRSGNIFTCYKSIDGTTWVSAGAVPVTMATNVFIGIPVFSGNLSPAKAIVDNVTVTTSVTAAPAAPTALYATSVTSTGLTLNWTDTSSNETGFRIERSSTGLPGSYAVVGTVGAGVQSYTESGLTSGKIYHYHAIAYNSGGDGVSVDFGVFTSGGALPSLLSQGKPALASSDKTDHLTQYGNDGDTTGSIAHDYGWATSTDTFPGWWRVDLGAVYPLTKVKIYWFLNARKYQYRIEVSNDDTNYTTVVDMTNNTTISGDTTDYFTASARYVRVTITGGTGTSSPRISFYECQVFEAGTEPAAATGLGLTVNNLNQITLGWTDNATNETGFKIERKASSTGAYTQVATVGASAGTGGTVSYTDSGLSPGIQYYYRVLAYSDTDGNALDYAPATGASEISATTTTGGAFTRDYWTGVSGTSVSSLTTWIGSHPTPTGTTTLNTFEAPFSWADSFGEKIYGSITAPADGNYNFWIASDDDSELWLSTDSTEANSVLIAKVGPALVAPVPRDWTTFTGNTFSGSGNIYQNSAPVALLSGHTYYIKALHKGGGGADHLAVAWSGPGFTRQVLSDNSSVMTSSITSPSDGSTTTEGSNITINASATAGSGRSITKVEFLLNGDSKVEAKLGEDTTYPYSFTWNSVAAGSYIITERAWDTAGVSTSSSIRVTVTNSSFASGTWTDRILNGDGSINWTEYANVANNYDRRDMVEYRLGPNYTYYHPGGGTFVTRDNQSGEDGVLGRPYNLSQESDWYSEGGQMIFSPNASASTAYQSGVAEALNGDIYTWASGSPGYCFINGIQWNGNVMDEVAHGQSLPDPSVQQAAFKAANGGTVPPPVATVRTGGAGGISGFLLFKNGFITSAGNGATDSYGSVPGDLPRYAFTQLAAGKVPTAGAVTTNTEFLLVTVWDTTNHKGQVAVIAINAQIRAQQTAFGDHQLGDFMWGMPNRFTVRSLKVLGYVDLPTGMAAPSAISVSDDMVQKDGVGDSTNVGLNAQLDSQTVRDYWLAWTGDYRKTPKSGYAVVASRSENKVAFLDLQPLFEYYRQMYFTTQANYDQTKIQGPADSQWPYTFAYVSSQAPTVASTISVTQPTAVMAGLPQNPNGGSGTTNGYMGYAYIATMDGHLYIYAVNDLMTTDSAALPSLYSTVTIGKNPTGLDFNVEFTAGTIAGTLVNCRGDKEIRLIDPSGVLEGTLTDSRIVDPVYASASKNGRGSYNMQLIHVMDFEGSQILTYRYGGTGSLPAVNDSTHFEYTHTDPLPGCPIMYTRMGVN